MPSPNEVYIKCDELDNIPKPNKENWLYEIELLKKELPLNAKVLQVGCMDGTRAIALLKSRPDLIITGLDIEQNMIDRSKRNLNKMGLKAEFIQGDITKLLSFSDFDYVVCLNNTLGYIPEQQKAIDNMKKIGKTVIISVYGEKFTDKLAKEYFKSINLEIVNIKNNFFEMKDFTSVKRYTKDEVERGGGKIINTPLGYFCIIS